MKAKIEISQRNIADFERSLNNLIDGVSKKTMDIVSTRIGIAFDRYTPKNTGYLRNSKHISIKDIDGKVKVGFRYDAPYAKYQYENVGNKFKHYTTIGTGDHWAEKAADEVKEIITQELINQLNQV